MVNFASVTTFRMRLSALLKVKRGVYAAVPDEICIAFKNATIEKIRQNRDMVLLNNDAVVIKLRLPDKKQHLSKADGYLNDDQFDSLEKDITRILKILTSIVKTM